MRWRFPRGRQREADLDEEIRTHLEMATRDRGAAGLPPSEARDAALREFGNVALVKEVTRDMWGWVWLDELLRDARVDLRALGRTPAFAATVVATLALGIGANVAIFTLINAVLIQPLPYPDPNRLVVIWEETARRPGRANTISPANFLRWRERSSRLNRWPRCTTTGPACRGAGIPKSWWSRQ